MKGLKLFALLLALAVVNIANAQATKSKKAVKTTKTTTAAAKPAATSSLSVDTKASTFGWLAKKVGGQHNGNVTVKSGSLAMTAGKLTGGEFTIDMNTITCADIANADFNGKLVGHLKADDFFGVATFPTSTFKITKVAAKDATNYDVTGDLTIKGITQSITFPATVSVDASGKATATAKFDIDRTKFGIKFRSKSFFEDIGDKMIYDNFTVDVKLVSVGKNS